MSKNYIPEIAKMLGVEVGEEFKIKNKHGCVFDQFHFCDDGLYRDLERVNTWLLALLHGEAEIVKKPWKPRGGESFYWCNFINGALYVADRFFNEIDGGDIACYRLGNCYRTKKEAEADREKWERFYGDDSPIEWEDKA